jgi:hypothetical protein
METLGPTTPDQHIGVPSPVYRPLAMPLRNLDPVILGNGIALVRLADGRRPASG